MNINLNSEKVVSEVRNSFGAELWGYLTSNGWTDILVNPDGTVWIDDGTMHEISCRTTAEGLTAAALTLASFSSQKFNTKEAQSLVTVIPILNIRCSFMGPPAVERVSVSFRNPSKGIMMPEKLLEYNVMSSYQMDFLKDAIKNYRNILVSGGTGCHAKGERILMYDKSVKEVQTIQVGELLMGDDGEPRKVLELHKGYSPLYKICPLGGTPYVVNEKHVLVLLERTTGKRKYMTVEDFLLRPESWQRNMCVYYSKIRPGSKDKHKVVPFHVFKAGTGMYYGFTVDKNNLYCMHDYMVVHNSGKTTIMNSLMTFIEPTDRLYVAEDTSELVFTQPNVFNLKVNEDFSYAEAIAQALRHNPTRIIIGECRYPEQAIEMLQSWNTGHPGGFCTLHANSAREVVQRLTELANRKCQSDQSAMVREAVDVVLQMRKVPGSSKRILAELWDARKDVLI